MINNLKIQVRSTGLVIREKSVGYEHVYEYSCTGPYPRDVHMSTWALTKTEVPGGLADGPVYYTTYKSQLGLRLTHEDAYAAFQNDYVVYHDDIGDYVTNEPTMDGTACAIMMMICFE